MIKHQTPLQALMRSQNPQWMTPEGRVMDEALETFRQMSSGKQPQTVLAGLALNGIFGESALFRGRTVGNLAAVVEIDPIQPNHRGDTVRDVLDDLIEIGWVETEEPQPGSIEAALAHPPDEPNRLLHYRLVGWPLADGILPNSDIAS